jgi:hypothetical protein
MKTDLAERLLFLRAFGTHPRMVGAVLPTSRWAVVDMLDMADIQRAKSIVELGAGTGVYTQEILARLRQDARVLDRVGMLNPFATCPERLPPARSPVRPAPRIGGHRRPAVPTGLPAIAAGASDRARPSTASSSATSVSAVIDRVGCRTCPADFSAGYPRLIVGRCLVRLAATVGGKHLAGHLSHSAFNNLMEGVAGVAIATSPAVMAHVNTETGVVTMIIMVLVAGYLLTRRAADFDKAEPKSPRATTDPAPLHERQVRRTPARSAARRSIRLP